MKKGAAHRGSSSFLLIAAAAAFAKQERNTPQAGKPDDRVNDPAKQRILTAKDPGNQIKLENPHQCPVQRTYNGKK